LSCLRLHRLQHRKVGLKQRGNGGPDGRTARRHPHLCGRGRHHRPQSSTWYQKAERQRSQPPPHSRRVSDFGRDAAGGRRE